MTPMRFAPFVASLLTFAKFSTHACKVLDKLSTRCYIGNQIDHRSLEYQMQLANAEALTDKGHKYVLDIEGKEVPWDKDTITTEEIVGLGGWPVGQVVVEVDQDNNEVTLIPGQVIEVKPGHGFGKKHKWKRG